MRYKHGIFVIVGLCVLVVTARAENQQPIYKAFNKAVYSQRFYSDGEMVYRKPHSVITRCYTNQQEDGVLILETKRTLFPDAKSEVTATSRFSATQVPYTKKGVDFKRSPALSFDALSADRLFPYFPEFQIKEGDQWNISAPAILYDWGDFESLKDRQCDVKHHWVQTVEEDGYRCAEIEITIDDKYVDEKANVSWHLHVEGRVFFALDEGLHVWENFKVKMIKQKKAQAEVVKTGRRMAYMIDYQP